MREFPPRLSEINIEHRLNRAHAAFSFKSCYDPFECILKEEKSTFRSRKFSNAYFHLLREAQEDAKRAQETTSFAQVNQEKQRVRQLH